MPKKKQARQAASTAIATPASAPVASPYLTANEAAQYLRIKLRTFEDLAARNTFTRYQSGGKMFVYHRSTLDAYLLSRELRGYHAAELRS
jgi:excisionase family DNA binding protein